MKNYFLHKSLNPAADYFQEPGPEIKVSMITYYFQRMLKAHGTIRDENGKLLKTTQERIKE